MQIISLAIQAACASIASAMMILTSPSAIADVLLMHDGAGKETGTILIHSEIKRGDLADFARAADKIREVTRYKVNDVPHIFVDLDTPGGDVMEALRIGRITRDRFMSTRVLPARQCVSACVFILMAGSSRYPTYSARVGLHRPRFDPSYFANMAAENARSKYNALVEELRKYFFEMGGTEEGFHIMLSTPSDRVRYLTIAEVDKFGFSGHDPSWQELNDAKFVERYGEIRWRLIKPCAEKSGDLKSCEKKAYELYPAN